MVRKRFLALGDSYTIGESVEAHERWPSQLVSLLSDARIEIASPTIIARTGWTTADLLAAIELEQPEGVFDIVSLQIGVNNQYDGLELSSFVSELDQLLDKATAFAGGDPSRVIVLSIPDWGVTPFAEGRDRLLIASEIDRFRAFSRLL
jgi:hypothetical protein